MRTVSLLILLFLFSFTTSLTSGNVILISNNITLSFDDIEANFAPAVKGSGKCGKLYLAEPLDACKVLTNEVKRVSNASLPFVLIIRGGCSFEEKVRIAQRGGFKAAIVYDNEDGVLVSMAGNAGGIKIPAVFVSKASGQVLKTYAGLSNVELWIIPSFENSAWSIMAISFISLLAISAMMATCFFVRRNQLTRERPRPSRVQESNGMSSRSLKAIPSMIFTSVLEDMCTSITCAICLEDYNSGERLRVLPCRHKFHASCIDSWLSTWRTFCPVCKRDARTSKGESPASESTPLLSISIASASASALSSARSSSSAIQIMQASPGSTPIPRNHSSLASTSPYIQQNSLRSHHQSPNSYDLRNGSSQRSHSSYLVSPHSSGYPSFLPSSSRYISPFIRSPSNNSPSLVSSSGHLGNSLRWTESAASFSPYASTHSLPES